MSDDTPLLTLTQRFGFSEEDRRVIAKWWVDSGDPRWDKHADSDSPACTMECVEFVTTVVRGQLNALKDEYNMRPKKTLKAKRRTP